MLTLTLCSINNSFNLKLANLCSRPSAIDYYVYVRELVTWRVNRQHVTYVLEDTDRNYISPNIKFHFSFGAEKRPTPQHVTDSLIGIIIARREFPIHFRS